MFSSRENNTPIFSVGAVAIMVGILAMSAAVVDARSLQQSLAHAPKEYGEEWDGTIKAHGVVTPQASSAFVPLVPYFASLAGTGGVTRVWMLPAAWSRTAPPLLQRTRMHLLAFALGAYGVWRTWQNLQIAGAQGLSSADQKVSHMLIEVPASDSSPGALLSQVSSAHKKSISSSSSSTSDEQRPSSHKPQPMLISTDEREDQSSSAALQQKNQIQDSGRDQASLEDLMKILETFPTQELQKRVSSLTLAGEPAFSSQEISEVSWYITWQFLETLNHNKRRFFLGHVLDLQGRHDGTERSGVAEELILSFSQHLQRFVKVENVSVRSLASSKEKSGGDRTMVRNQSSSEPTRRKFRDLEELDKEFAELATGEVTSRLLSSEVLQDSSVGYEDYLTEECCDKLRDFVKKSPPIRKHIFYATVMGMDDINLRDIQREHSADRKTIIHHRDYLAAKLRNIIKTGHSSGRVIRDLNQLDDEFFAMSNDKIISLLRHSETLEGFNLDKYSRLSQEKINHLRFLIKNSAPAKRHVFYRFFLNLDESISADINKKYLNGMGDPRSYKYRMRMQIINLVKLDNEKVFYAKEFKDLKDEFFNMSIADLRELLTRSRLLKNTKKDSLMSEGDRYDALRDFVARLTPMQQHVVFSIIMIMDNNNISNMASKYGRTKATLSYHTRRLLPRIINIVNTGNPSGYFAKSFKDLEEEFNSFDRFEILDLMRRSDAFEGIDFDAHPELSEERYIALKNFIAWSEPVKRHIAYSLIFHLDESKGKDIALHHGKERKTWWSHSEDLKEKIINIYLAGHPQGVLTKTLDEMEEDFIGLSKSELMELLRKYFVSVDFDINYINDLSDSLFNKLQENVLLKDSLDRHILYSIILRLDNNYATNISKKYGYSKRTVARHKWVWEKELLDMLVSKN